MSWENRNEHNSIHLKNNLKNNLMNNLTNNLKNNLKNNSILADPIEHGMIWFHQKRRNCKKNIPMGCHYTAHQFCSSWQLERPWNVASIWNKLIYNLMDKLMDECRQWAIPITNGCCSWHYRKWNRNETEMKILPNVTKASLDPAAGVGVNVFPFDNSVRFIHVIMRMACNFAASTLVSAGI